MKARAVLLLCCSVGIIGNEGDSFLESCDTILYFVSFNLFLSSYSLKGLSIFNNNKHNKYLVFDMLTTVYDINCVHTCSRIQLRLTMACISNLAFEISNQRFLRGLNTLRDLLN